jgi:hypothetical protein
MVVRFLLITGQRNFFPFEASRRSLTWKVSRSATAVGPDCSEGLGFNKHPQMPSYYPDQNSNRQTCGPVKN